MPPASALPPSEPPSQPDLAEPSDSLVRLFERPGPGLAVAPPARSGRGAWRATLTRDRLLVAALVTPLLFWAFLGQIGRPLDLAWFGALSLISAVGAMTLATYLPQRTAAGSLGSSPCASIAGVYVLFAGLALAGEPAGLAQGVLGLGLVSFGLLQRLRGATACGG
jgi:hypothetical protein